MKVLILFVFLLFRLSRSQDLRNRVPVVDGYSVEYHNVTTQDGYILGMYRFPGSPLSPVNLSAPPKTVVFLMHGLLSSWADWVVLGAGKAISYQLADAGYDVWMGNARGNTFSRNNVNISANNEKFWDFSWHQIGIYDLPAMINYVLSVTKQHDLHYIGHSQGTTSFFVMASMIPQMNAVIRTMHAYAPVAFMNHETSPFFRALAPAVDAANLVTELLGVGEFLPSSTMMQNGGQLLCQNNATCTAVCANVLFLIGGFDSPQLNCTIVPAIVKNAPAGASVDQFVHYGQEINSGYFRQFDYYLGNPSHYNGALVPPNYNLSAITSKIYLHYGCNDWLAAVTDVMRLSSLLPNGTCTLMQVSDPLWEHLDFIFGTDASTLVYNSTISIIQNN